MVKKGTTQLDTQWRKFRKEINQDFKLHVGALTEDFDEKVKIIAEQHLTIMQVLQNHTRQIKDIEERIISMDIKLDRITENLQKRVEYEDFRNLVKRVTLLETRVGRKA